MIITRHTNCFKTGLFLLVSVLASINSHSQPLNKNLQQRLKPANRHEKAGWIYLHIEGPASERGFQHGYLLAKEIQHHVQL